MRALTAVVILLAWFVPGCGGTDENDAGPDFDAGSGTLDAAIDAAAPDGGEDDDAGPADGGAPVCVPQERDLWVWNDAVATDVAARDALFAFARDRQVRAVYVESQALVARDDATISDFVAAASGQCLQVDLLFGDPTWARSANHSQLLALVRRAVMLAAAAPTPPRGVHLDVEPYVLPEWTSARDTIAGAYFELLMAVAAELSGAGLELTVDIPFWFDEISIDPGSGERRLSELVQELADRTVILAYRDHAAPPDGIIDHSQDELDFASSIGRPLVVAVETTCGLDPEKVSFCEEGRAVLETELDAARVAFEGEAGFGGFAIHHYGAYRDLIP